MCKILPQLQALVVNEGITIGALERQIGASKGVLSRAINNGTDIQTKWISAIVEKYPQYSTRWLLSGIGHMLKSEKKTSVNSPALYSKNQMEELSLLPVKEKGAIPLVSEKAVGGFSNGDFSIAERDVIAYYTIPKFRNLCVDFMIELTGDSMIPRFSPGDIIACSIITNPSFIQWNKCHLIASRAQGLIVKRLMPGENKTFLKAVSENPAYPPFDIPKDDICGIALIVGSIHLE